MGCPVPHPITFGGGRAWWHLCNNVCVSLPPATGTGEGTLFWGVSGRRLKSPFSAPAARSWNAPSPFPSYRHIDLNRRSQPYTYSLSPMPQRKSDGGMVVGAVGRAVPTSSWGSHFDSKDEAGAAQGVSRICRCLPPSLSSLPSHGWHRALDPWSSGPNTSTSTGINWPWPLPPNGPSFVRPAGILTPHPSPSCLLLIQTPVHVSPPSSHQPRWPLGIRAACPRHQGDRQT